MRYSVNMKSKKGSKSGAKRSKKDLNLRAFNPAKLSGGKTSKTKGKGKRPYIGFTKKRKKKNFRQKFGKVLVILIGLFFFVMVGGLIAGGLYLKHLEKSLPDPDRLVQRSSDQSTIILDRDGNELYKIYADQNREFVKLDELPEHFKWAILSAEDIEFYNHKGLDLMAVASAAYSNLALGRVARGASTITQQLVRNTILFDVLGEDAYEQNYTRKLQEMLITMQIEQTLSKDEILQMYVNEVPFGGVNYGIQAASLAYFGKDAKDLTLAESAMLAGVIASPSNFSPIYGSDPDLSVRRQHIVLDLMLRNTAVTGITEEDIEAAKEEELEYASKRIEIDAPHFVFYIKQELEDIYGIDRVERGGLRVTTSLDYSMQQIAEEEITKGIAEYGHRWNVNNGAMVVIDPRTNQVLAMVGSVDFWETDNPKIDGNVNVTTRLRQMGSSVKPYTYLTALHQGYGPWLQTPDIKEIDLGNYDLTNWDKGYLGPMTAREALVRSRNVPAAYTLQLVGIDAFIETAEKVGITSLVHRDSYGLSLTLGAGEMTLLEHTAGMGVFASGGVKRPLISILEVVDSNGEVLYEFEETDGERVFDERDIYAMNWIMCDIGRFGDQLNSGYYFINGVRVCGKTGTTDGPKDLSAIMYHKNLVVGVWAGNNNNIETPGAWSTTVPLPIANSFMNRVSSKFPPKAFDRPAGIQTISICKDTGWLADSDNSCDKAPSIYVSGKAPPRDKRKVIEVCKDSGLIPTNRELAERFDLLEKKMLFVDYQIENARQVEAYAKYLAGRKRSNVIFSEPKTGECKLPSRASAAPRVEITSPQNNQNVEPGQTINISFTTREAIAIERTEVYFNSDLIREGSFRLPNNLNPGDHKITVTVFDINGKDASHSVTVRYTPVQEDPSPPPQPPNENNNNNNNVNNR
jgi:membrane peptidoglycan carboxypeptidase